MKHEVVFNIGTGHVVCSCGDYFKADSPVHQSWDYVPMSAVEKWANHLRETNGNN